MWKALVMIVRYQVEYVFLQVGGRAAYGMDFLAADHFGQRNAEFGGAHRAGHGQKHLASFLQVFHPSLRRVDHHR